MSLDVPFPFELLLIARCLAGCIHVNPGIGAQLDEIYRQGTFEVEGKTYKCHPDYQ